MLIWACSPHEGGVTDVLARTAAAACRGEIIFLRSFTIYPCTGCGYCKLHGACHIQDDAPWLFDQLAKASCNIFLAPVYFYNLPAHFKAFIDRAQVFWNMGPLPQTGSACSILAGATHGPKLFDGARLTLKYFLQALGKSLAEVLGLPGLNTPADLTPEQLAKVYCMVRNICDNT